MGRYSGRETKRNILGDKIPSAGEQKIRRNNFFVGIHPAVPIYFSSLVAKAWLCFYPTCTAELRDDPRRAKQTWSVREHEELNPHGLGAGHGKKVTKVANLGGQAQLTQYYR